MSTVLVSPQPPRTGVRSDAGGRAFSAVRSVGMAAAISLHLALLLVLMRPMATPLPPPEVETVVRVLPDLVPPPPPPPIAVAASPQPLDLPADPSPPALEAPVFDAGPPGPNAVAASLRLLEGGAPRYPRRALMRRVEGEVELLILVGIDGRAIEVTVARGSGHAELDRAAVEHAKRRWVFEPSRRNGAPVPAWARVPVRFTLPR